MGVDTPISLNTMERRRPKKGPPSGGSSTVFMSLIQKNNLAQRGPDEAAEQPPQEWDTSGTKNEVTNPLDMTMREKYTEFSCWNYR